MSSGDESRRLPPLYALTPRLWALAGAVAVVIVIFNKAVIGDRGSSWVSLLMVAAVCGLIAAHVAKAVGKRAGD